MNFGGVIAGAMEGGAKAVQGMAQGYIDDERRANMARLESDIALSRAKALEIFKQQSADGARLKRADDINARSKGIIDRQRAAGVNAAYGDGSNLTPEDLTEEEMAEFGGAPDEEAARLQAAKEGGYIDPKDELSASTRMAGLEGQNQRLRDTLASREREGAANRDSREGIAEANREAANARADARIRQATGGKADQTKLTTMKSTAKDVIKAMTAEGPPRDPAARARWQARLDEEYAIIDKVNEQLNSKLDGSEAPPPPQQPAKPKAPTSGLPAPKTRAEYDKLKSGTRYTAPDGSIKIKG